MVTIYDIAKKCGVSPSTVSKAVNDYPMIPEATKDKIYAAMAELDYVPNVSARSLSKRKSHIIGVLAYFGRQISPFKHPLFTEMLDSFQTAINAAGYELLLISHNVAGQKGSFLKNAISNDVAGVVLFGNFEHPEMKEILNSSIPKVAFDYVGNLCTNVSSQSKRDMRDLTKYLLSLGHRNVVFIHGEDSIVTRLRIEGFKEALEDAGLPFQESMLVEGRYLDIESAKNLTEKILNSDNRPTAILYPDDSTAVASLETISSFGLSCPRDISITGYDGLNISQIVTPHLTTVRQDLAGTGAALARKLIEQIEKPNASIENLIIPASILLGTSTDKPKK